MQRLCNYFSENTKVHARIKTITISTHKSDQSQNESSDVPSDTSAIDKHRHKTSRLKRRRY